MTEPTKTITYRNTYQTDLGSDSHGEVEMRACPFCGELDELYLAENTACAVAYIECPTCHGQGPYVQRRDERASSPAGRQGLLPQTEYWKRDAVLAWNRRMVRT